MMEMMKDKRLAHNDSPNASEIISNFTLLFWQPFYQYPQVHL